MLTSSAMPSAFSCSFSLIKLIDLKLQTNPDQRFVCDACREALGGFRVSCSFLRGQHLPQTTRYSFPLNFYPKWKDSDLRN